MLTKLKMYVYRSTRIFGNTQNILVDIEKTVSLLRVLVERKGLKKKWEKKELWSNWWTDSYISVQKWPLWCLALIQSASNQRWAETFVSLTFWHQQYWSQETTLKKSASACCLKIDFNSCPSTTIHRIQAFYVIPSIKELWREMKGKLSDPFENKELFILCGDGRMDSPGFRAKLCLYNVMNHRFNCWRWGSGQTRGRWHFFTHGKDGLQRRRCFERMVHAGAKPPIKPVTRASHKQFQYSGQGFWFFPPEQPRKILPCEDWLPHREKWRTNTFSR